MDNYHQVWDIICIRERSSDSGIKDRECFERHRRLPFKKLTKCSKYHFPLKEPKFLREMIDSMCGARNV